MSTTNTNTNNQSAKKNIRFEHDLIEGIENLKDPLIPFAAWVKQACREKLQRDSAPVCDPIPTSEPVVSPAPVSAPSAITSGAAKSMHTHEAEIMAVIIKLKNDGYKPTAIATELNKYGYLSSTMQPFSKGSVEGIIRRKINGKK